MDSHRVQYPLEPLEPPDLTATLPDEVLEQVLSLLPAEELVESVVLVCHRWRRLLSLRSLWRRVRLRCCAGREPAACRVLQVAPALAELALFPGDRVPTRCPGLVLRAVRRAAAAGLELRALVLDWRHFAADPACFHGVLDALRDVVRDLDVGLVGVEAPGTALPPRPTPAFASLAALTALQRLRVRALFDPWWYFEELRAPHHALRTLDLSGCEPYLSRLLGDLLAAHRATLRSLRLNARTLALHELQLPALDHLAVDLEHQDAAVTLRGCGRLHIRRLTLANMNRRLPPPLPREDAPSEAVRTVTAQPWPALRTLVLEDCLLSPADLCALLAGLGLGLALSPAG